jgi:hypothetical protein
MNTNKFFLYAFNTIILLGGMAVIGTVVFSKEDDNLRPWENMGNNVRQVCDVAYRIEYEWGVTYNNDSPILRVTCNSWNVGQRVCTYPPYPTGDSQPFTWGGACWVWDSNSSLDDPCSVAYHFYYYQDAAGKMYMNSGNGCNALPTVWRRKL